MALRIASLVLLAGPMSFALPIDKSALASRQNNPINGLLGVATGLPPINLLVGGASGLLTNLQSVTAPLSGGPVNRTDIADNKPCADMTLIFARGTTEPGNMGGLVGPQLVQAIQKAMPGRSLNVQGVEYAANVQGYLGGGGADGTASMSTFLQKTQQQCPQSKIVLSGYSQGGQVVHNTAKAVGAASMAQVNSVVIFGDPFSKTPVPGAESKTLVICHKDDNICENGILILPPHLTYGFDTPQAGAFIAQLAGSPAAAPPAAQPAAPVIAPAAPPAAAPATAPAATPAAAPINLPAALGGLLGGLLPAATPAAAPGARI